MSSTSEENRMKKCSKCGELKPVCEFANNKCSTATHDSNGNRLRRGECKVCTKSEAKQRGDAYKLAGKPAAPPAGTPCQLCAEPGTERFPILRFDHDHTTLKHRGWLCDPCNRSLGVLGDDLEAMIKVVNYLQKTEKRVLTVDPTTGFVTLGGSLV
jgi:hypothetical protein